MGGWCCGTTVPSGCRSSVPAIIQRNPDPLDALGLQFESLDQQLSIAEKIPLPSRGVSPEQGTPCSGVLPFLNIISLVCSYGIYHHFLHLGPIIVEELVLSGHLVSNSCHLLQTTVA